MPELAGKNCVIKLSGDLVAMVGEPMTLDGSDKIAQIADATKRVLDRTGVIKVQESQANDAAESGTNTTNIKMTSHGLIAGDLICNVNRSNAYRPVLARVDADNITVATVTGQTTSDVIKKWKTAAAGTYTLNRLNGTVVFEYTTGADPVITGSYYPMTVAAYANALSTSRSVETHDVTPFGSDYKKFIAGLKSASGTLSHFDMADVIFSNALASGEPIVIEESPSSAIEPDRFWALIDKDELAADAGGVMGKTVSWVSTDAFIILGQ